MGFDSTLVETLRPSHKDAWTPLNYKPLPHQQRFHNLSQGLDGNPRVNSILFGGAAGPGKSCAMLMDAIDTAFNYPGIKIGCFRRTHPELQESFIAELQKRQFARPLGCRWNATERTLYFQNGALIRFTYAENEVDASRIQGGEYQMICIDESTLMPGKVIGLLEERMRSSDRGVPVFGLRCASNPGGVSHSYHLNRFIKPTRYGREIFEDVNEERGITRRTAFIPGNAEDNPYLDAGYHLVLDSIPDEQRRKAMRDGDWSAMQGSYFQQWSQFRHVIPTEDEFELPKEWRRYCGIDYGTVAPWAVCWAAVDENGRLWVYREIYATGVQSSEQGRWILKREEEAGESDVIRVADPSMWGNRGTPLSIADEYGQVGCGIAQADNDRINGWSRVHFYLNDAPACEYHLSQGLKECPMLHVFESKCPMFIDKIPSLPRSDTNPEDAATLRVEDHMPDALRYLCMYVGNYAQPIFYDDDPAAKMRATLRKQEERPASEQGPVLIGGRFAGNLGL